MRHLLLILGLLFLCEALQAQRAYELTAFTRPFLPLQTGTNVVQGRQWDFVSNRLSPRASGGVIDTQVYKFALPFPFHFYGMNVDSFTLFLQNPEGVAFRPTRQNPTMLAFIGPFDLGLADRGIPRNRAQSPIIFDTAGTSPNRVFTIEWRNAGLAFEIFHSNVDSSAASFVNSQIRFFERDSCFEVHFGPTYLNYGLPIDPFFRGEGRPVPIVVASRTNDTRGTSGPYTWQIAGDPLNPRQHTTSFNNYLELEGVYENALNAYPNDGTVWRFCPAGASSTENGTTAMLPFEIGPNPVREILHIVARPGTELLPSDAATLTVVNVYGQIVYQGDVLDILDATSWPAGAYTIMLKDDGLTWTKSFVKL